MPEAYIVEAVRSPSAAGTEALPQRTPMTWRPRSQRGHRQDRHRPDGGRRRDLGCVDQIGAQSETSRANAWLTAGLPDSVPGTPLTASAGRHNKPSTSRAKR